MAIASVPRHLLAARPWRSAEGRRRHRLLDEAGAQVFVSEALVGEPVGIVELESGGWLVRFADLDLDLIERKSRKLTRFTAARPGRREAEPTGNGVNDVPGPECQA